MFTGGDGIAGGGSAGGGGGEEGGVVATALISVADGAIKGFLK